MTQSRGICRKDAVELLGRFGICGPRIYLIDIIPLIEMVWADGCAQDAEIDILFDYLYHHVDHINRVAGYDMLTYDDAKKFVKAFLANRPDPKLLRALRSLIPSVRFSSSDNRGNRYIRESLLAACLDIASSSVLDYPYDFRDRFNPAEKKCFFEILDSLENRENGQQDAPA